MKKKILWAIAIVVGLDAIAFVVAAHYIIAFLTAVLTNGIKVVLR